MWIATCRASLTLKAGTKTTVVTDVDRHVIPLPLHSSRGQRRWSRKTYTQHVFVSRNATIQRRHNNLLYLFYAWVCYTPVHMSESKKKKIVVVGGGTGTHTLLRGLKRYADKLDITAIVTMADSGGSTGRLRDVRVVI